MELLLYFLPLAYAIAMTRALIQDKPAWLILWTGLRAFLGITSMAVLAMAIVYFLTI